MKGKQIQLYDQKQRQLLSSEIERVVPAPPLGIKSCIGARALCGVYVARIHKIKDLQGYFIKIAPWDIDLWFTYYVSDSIDVDQALEEVRRKMRKALKRKRRKERKKGRRDT